MRRPLLALAVLAGVAAPASAVDYAKLDRALKKEPAYASKAPQYALLVFGPEAELRVWCVLDGEAVYLDRNADGDLTTAGERFDSDKDIKDVPLADPDGVTKYTIRHVQVRRDEEAKRTDLDVNVAVKSPAVEYRQYSDAVPTADAKSAPVSHFHGPLTAGPQTVSWKVPPGTRLKTGARPTDLRSMVGTMSAEFGCWVVVESLHGSKPAFPDGVRPVIDIEFAPETPGAPPVGRRYQLDKLC